MNNAETLMMAMDLGTSHLKCLVVDSGGRIRHQSETRVPLVRDLAADAPAIDPRAVWVWVQQELDRFAGIPLAIAFSSAMHSFLPVDERGEPLDGAYTWMDRRSAVIARRMRDQNRERWHAATGTPLHAMSVAVKWRWWCASGHAYEQARVLGLKDWVVFRLTGKWVTDLASASATGLLSLTDADWDGEILRQIGLRRDQLPDIAPAETLLECRAGTLRIGGGDAAMAHFGLDARPLAGTGVISLGTSGAVRVNVSTPPGVLTSNFFCYRAIGNTGFLLGEAYSNIGNLWELLARQYHISVGELVERGLGRIRRSTQDIPLLLPFLYGERSPYWNEQLYPQWIGVDSRHTTEDFLAAAVASVLTVIYGGSRRIGAAVPELRHLRSGSKLLDLAGLASMVAAVSNFTISRETGLDASLLGAIRLGSEEAWSRLAGADGSLQVYDPDPPPDNFWQERSEREQQAAGLQIAQLAMRLGQDAAPYLGGEAR